MQALRYLIFFTFVAVCAADSSDDSNKTNWHYDITASLYSVGYDEQTQSISFYNPMMGMDITFDGNSGAFGIINTTTGSMLMVQSQTQLAKLVTPLNKDDIIKAFASKDKPTAFNIAGRAVSKNAHIHRGKKTFNLGRALARLPGLTKTTNDEIFEKKGETQLLTDIKHHIALLRITMISYIKTHPFHTYKSVLLTLAATLNGAEIVRQDFSNLMSTIITYLKGRFNKNLMDKVNSLIIDAHDKVDKNMFNTLSAAISLAAPKNRGLDKQVKEALKLAY